MSNVIEFIVKAKDEFSKTFGDASAATAALEKALAGVSIAALGYAAINLAQKSLEDAEALGVAAEKANLTTEEFSALAFAANMANVETGTLSSGLKMLGKAMAEGSSAPAGAALDALGVASRNANGQLRDVSSVLLDVADKFATAERNANLTNYAMTIFGRSGVDMVPMLRQGSAAIRDTMDQAKKLGLVISDDFAKSADALNDNLGLVAKTLQGSMNVAMQQMAPTLETLTGQVINFTTESGNIQRIGEIIATALRLIITPAIIVAGVFKTVGDVIGGVFASLALAAQGEFTQAFETLRSTSLDITRNVTGTVSQVGQVWGLVAEDVNRSTAQQMRSLANLGEVTEEQKRKQEQMKAAQEELDRARSRAQSIIESQMTAEEKHNALLAEMGTLYERGVMSSDQYTEAVRREVAAYDEATAKLIDYKTTATSVFDETSRQLTERFAEMGNETYQMASMMTNATLGMVKGVGDAVAGAIVDGNSLGRALEQVAKSVLRSVISMLVQIGVQRMVLSAISRTATASEASQKMGAAMGEVYLNSFASAASIPVVGWAMAPGIAAANTAVAGAGAAGAVAAGAGIAGIAHGGLDYVPAETTYLLDRGERVLSPRQNEDLTSFLQAQGGGGGGVTIQNLTVHILENATTPDAYLNMDPIQLRNMLGRPVVDALNAMSAIGVRPDFANEVR